VSTPPEAGPARRAAERAARESYGRLVAFLASRSGDVAAAEDALALAFAAALRQWPVDFNSGRLDAVCGLFADDVVLIYPDSANRDHDEFCDQMRKLFDDATAKFSYAAPDINEVIVDGDLAVVRLIWTLTVRNESGQVLETTVEDGVDVFRRQDDGSWKIHISHAFTR